MCPIGGPHRALIRETAFKGGPTEGPSQQIEDAYAPFVSPSPRNLFLLVPLSRSSCLPSLFLPLSPRSPVLLLSTSISFFPSSHNSDQRRENQAKAIAGAPTEPSAEGGGMGEGGKRHRPPPLPVSEIKRRGRNLAEGCKYYKVTLRRMRELKGLPREGGKRAPEDNASE